MIAATFGSWIKTMSPNDRTEVIRSAEAERVSRGDEVNDLSPERPPKTSKIGHLTARR